MQPPRPSRTIQIGIARPPDAVYDFVMDPANLPRWAPNFARSVQRSGDAWVAETDDGPMRVAFVAPNPFRVADHTVTVRPGLEITNPVRVLANGDGAEVTFTLFQAPDVSDAAFAADAGRVEDDLRLLKRLLEAGEA